MNSYESYPLRRLQVKIPGARADDIIDTLRRLRPAWTATLKALFLRNENMLCRNSHFRSQPA